MPSGPVILRRMSKAQRCKEDTTALLLAKMLWIGTDNTKPYFRTVDEIVNGDEKERIENVIHTLVGYIVQLSEGAGNQGFLWLCTWLAMSMQDKRLTQLPDLHETWRSK